MARLLLSVIRFYRRFVSPMTPSSCRFTPTCSGYAEQAVARYGAARGGWLALRRLLRCHPFGPSGYDPVPGIENDSRSDSNTRRTGDGRR
jgi:hypothetical protein